MERALQLKLRPLVYLITDRRAIPTLSSEPDLDHLIDFVSIAFDAGVDMVQIRERDLSARALLRLCREISTFAVERRRAVLINDRADLAASADIGVHLPVRSLPVDVVRRAFGPEMMIGASTHSIDEAEEAARNGADFLVFGPVFQTHSKAVYGPPVGLDALRDVAALVNIPVLALGGLNLQNFHHALAAGAAGVAGISLFANRDQLKDTVSKIRAYRAQ